MEQIAPLLEKLAAQLGTTADKLWTVLIRQAYVSAIQDLVFSGILIVALILSPRVFRWLTKNKKEAGQWSGEGWFVGILFFWLFSFVAVVIVMLSFYNASTAIFNPEYWALSEILSTIKGR